MRTVEYNIILQILEPSRHTESCQCSVNDIRLLGYIHIMEQPVKHINRLACVPCLIYSAIVKYQIIVCIISVIKGKINLSLLCTVNDDLCPVRIKCRASLLSCHMLYNFVSGSLACEVYNRHALLDNACLLSCNLFYGISQVLGMIETNAGDGCHTRLYAVCGIKSSAHSCLIYNIVCLLLGKIYGSHGKQEFEICRMTSACFYKLI